MEDKLIEKAFIFLKEYPYVYEPSTALFWDDENISLYMLKAHLDQNTDAASRPIKFIEKSVDWILKEYGKEYPSVLDLGCGPGLYTSIFAKKGSKVIGIDYSKRSINYAKEDMKKNNLEIDYRYQNYLDIDFVDAFDVITLIYYDFGVLSNKDRHELLRRITRALKKGGILVLDAYSLAFSKEYVEGQWVDYQNGGFWSKDEHICIQRNKLYVESNNILDQYIIITKDTSECFNIWNQLFSKEALEDELKEVGFKDISFFNNVVGDSYNVESSSMCIIARK